MSNALVIPVWNNPKMRLVWRRLKHLFANGWWLGKNTLWIGLTSCVALVMPVLFFYEKECQMGETQRELQKLYVAAHGPQLTT